MTMVFHVSNGRGDSILPRVCCWIVLLSPGLKLVQSTPTLVTKRTKIQQFQPLYLGKRSPIWRARFQTGLLFLTQKVSILSTFILNNKWKVSRRFWTNKFGGNAEVSSSDLLLVPALSVGSVGNVSMCFIARSFVNNFWRKLTFL